MPVARGKQVFFGCKDVPPASAAVLPHDPRERRLGVTTPRFVGEHDCLHAVAHSEFHHRSGHVCLHGRLTDDLAAAIRRVKNAGPGREDPNPNGVGDGSGPELLPRSLTRSTSCSRCR